MDCPACGTTRIDRQVLQRHKRYRLYQCGRCGVQFWWPTKHPGAAWYAECDIYGGRIFGANHSRTFWNHRQFLMEPLARGDLLDVACGEGAFLAAAQRAGYRVNGIDFDAEAVRIARESLGLERVWPISVDDFMAETQRRFDVVTIRQQQMNTEGMLTVLHRMMPYGILWHRAGRLLAKRGRASRGETAHLARKALIRGMRALRAAHRLALVPAAAMTAFILRRRGQLGLGLYACARVRDDS